ncbi:GmrSD restriction endonuclease domain-containing protein, partial [Escherichia coli]
MKSETLTIQQLFQNQRQYRVPFYQRAYVWTQQNQWSALLEDIFEKAHSRL